VYEWNLHIERTHDSPATLDDLMRFNQALRIEPDIISACTSIDSTRRRICATFTFHAEDASIAADAGTACINVAATIAGLPTGTITGIEIEPATHRARRRRLTALGQLVADHERDDGDGISLAEAERER